MKKLVIAMIVFIFSSSVNAQYSLVPAFPNLGTFNKPTEFINSGDGTNRMFLVEEFGLIYVFANNPQVSTKKVFLDLRDKVATFVQTGILGLAFHPNYKNNRYIYVYYVYNNATLTGFISRISRFTTSANNPDSALSSTEVVMIDKPVEYPGHYGGKIAFGRDGYLYISLGDAGTGSTGGDLAQDMTSLKGKLLRIDVNIPSGGLNYSIPVSNPFAGNTQGIMQEIYASGFRNMWKFSYDSVTNVMWGADVGEHRYEEINLIQKGKNYGWNMMEGFHCYSWPDTNFCDSAGRGFSPPIFEYTHDEGLSVIGGYVYRGIKFPELYGRYIYGDYVAGKIWALAYPSLVNTVLVDSNMFIVSFGTDENKEIYTVSAAGNIYKFHKPSKTLSLSALIEGHYSYTKNKMIKDTVSVYLRSQTAPYQLIDSSHTILDSTGFGSVNFSNANNSVPYYIIVSHRNSIEVWSKTGFSFVADNLSYNFTLDSSMSYGNNTKLVDYSPLKFALYSGDVDQNGVIDLDDVVIIQNDANLFKIGNIGSDINGNGYVELSDLICAFNNSIDFIHKVTP